MTINLCLFGAGRIGAIHAANIAANPRARLRAVVDIDPARAQAVAEPLGAIVTDAETAFADPAIDGVVIAAPTPQHAPLIEAALASRKAIFCEKPVDLDCARAEAVAARVAEHGAWVLVAFNRRFDPDFAALHARIGAGDIGAVELVAITSRDPAPPPIDYVKASGGLFRDMMIHDFDMARWLLGAEPIEVYAAASCLVDPAIGAAGDFDTAVVTLRTAAGTIARIDNSRRAVYGYDQRIEAFGSGGMVRAGNRLETTVEVTTPAGNRAANPLHFFLERYADAYRAEMDHFLDCIEGRATPRVGIDDGVRALRLADAATTSAQTGQAVRLRP